MLGNDIVDLQKAKIESNYNRKGYLDKIFTLDEKKYIEESINQEVAVWKLWSRKEAVYKIIIRQGGNRGYYPIKIECLNDGIVQFEKELFYTKTYFNKHFIYTEAVTNLKDFKNIKTVKISDAIFKINNIPFINSNAIIFNVSKTHHGRFEKIIYLKK